MLSPRQVFGFAGALGIGLTLSSSQAAPSVIVVGAGAAGMSAAYLLVRAGVSVTVLEAASSHGGIIKTSHDFADFPIPLGGEWVHSGAQELRRIVADDDVVIDIDLVPYRDSDIEGHYDGSSLRFGPAELEGDLKFVGHSWLTFFDTYLVPVFRDRLKVNAPVASIDHSASGVAVAEVSGQVHHGDAAIVTVPVTVMRERDISFSPPLPQDKVEAFEQAFVWGGFKMFIEFSDQFYPTFLEIDGSYSDAGEKLWYDAAYGQRSSANVLGLFTVGDQSEPYQALPDDELRDFVLAELDGIFDGAVSKTYIQHVAQNWNAEPFIGQAYLASSADWKLPPRMRAPVGERLYFAGDAYTDGEDWSSVHTAAQSARQCVDMLAQAGIVDLA